MTKKHRCSAIKLALVIFATIPSIIEYVTLHTQTAIPTLHPKPTTPEYTYLYNQTKTPTITPTAKVINTTILSHHMTHLQGPFATAHNTPITLNTTN